ncbi:MAG: prepilin-type N-terminal cleavage/methylation domain-containing protein [Patescibacteria group bacterium]|jgi:type II secretion system protein G
MTSELLKKVLAAGKIVRGFTLIELLVVISIIGFLSTFAIVSLKSSRMKARDARRMAELKQIRTALNMYFDANASFPTINRACSAACTSPASCVVTPNWTTLVTALAPYIKLPADPLNTNPYCYAYDSEGGAGFGLIANMEVNTAAESSDGGSYVTLYEVGPDIRATWW